MTVIVYFSPFNNHALDNVDRDLGSGGPMILPGALKPEEADLITPELLERAITFLRRSFRYVIVDLGVALSETVLAVVDHVQHVVLVVTPEISAVKASADALEILLTLGIPTDQVSVLLNHRGLKPAVLRPSLERMLGKPVDVEMLFDGGRPDEAALHGNILSLTDPKSEVTKGVEALANRLEKYRAIESASAGLPAEPSAPPPAAVRGGGRLLVEAWRYLTEDSPGTTPSASLGRSSRRLDEPCSRGACAPSRPVRPARSLSILAMWGWTRALPSSRSRGPFRQARRRCRALSKRSGPREPSTACWMGWRTTMVDGASHWQRTTRVTLPLTMRTVLLVTLVSVIGSLLAFDQFFLMTSGQPRNLTATSVFYVYLNSFPYLKLGYGAALSLILAAMILFFTVMQLILTRRSHV